MTRSFGLIALAMGAFAAAAPAVADAKCVLGKIAELPVTMSGLTPTVAAKVDGHDAEFIADTGAFFSLITPGAAAKFGLRLQPAIGVTLEGANGPTETHLAQAKAFTVLGVTFPHTDFLVAAPQLSSRVDGLLGENFLGLADAEFDLADGIVRLFHPVGCEKAELAYWSTPDAYAVMDIGAITHEEDSIHGLVKVDGVTLKAVFDTGAPRSMLGKWAAKRAGIKLDGPDVRPGGLAGGIGHGEYETWIAPVTSLEIGGEQVRNTEMRVADFELPGVDLLIGADFFLSHHLYVAKSQGKLYFTYSGGPVFNLDNTRGPMAAPPPGVATTVASETPSDAAGFSRRAAASEARGQLEAAIADWTSAAALAPSDPQPLVDRGAAYLRQGKGASALADFDAALKLKPDDVKALTMRGALRLRRGDTAGAAGDFDAAVKADPTQRLAVADVYLSDDHFAEAVSQYDAWVSANPKSDRLVTALAHRCWTRALWGRDLDQAGADCDAALRLEPESVSVRDSRGLVRLRRGELDKAIADYDAVLRQDSKSAWSLYGRGLAKLRKGLEAEGKADIAAALAIRPSLEARAKKLGLTP